MRSEAPDGVVPRCDRRRSRGASTSRRGMNRRPANGCHRGSGVDSASRRMSTRLDRQRPTRPSPATARRPSRPAPPATRHRGRARSGATSEPHANLTKARTCKSQSEDEPCRGGVIVVGGSSVARTAVDPGDGLRRTAARTMISRASAKRTNTRSRASPTSCRAGSSGSRIETAQASGACFPYRVGRAARAHPPTRLLYREAAVRAARATRRNTTAPGHSSSATAGRPRGCSPRPATMPTRSCRGREMSPKRS